MLRVFLFVAKVCMSYCADNGHAYAGTKVSDEVRGHMIHASITYKTRATLFMTWFMCALSAEVRPPGVPVAEG